MPASIILNSIGPSKEEINLLSYSKFII
jgi:hypothetical protein